MLKTRLKTVFAICLIFGLVGCSIEGEMQNKNMLINCTDTRDGEKWSYNTNTVSNVRVGIGSPHSMDLVDTEGRKRHVTSDMETYIKCVPAN